MGADAGFLHTASREAGLDDELYRFVLYDAMISGVPATETGVRVIHAAIRKMGSKLRHVPIEEEKRTLRMTALFRLQDCLAERALPVKSTAQQLCRRLYGVDDYRWLKLDQLAALIWEIHKGGADNLSIEGGAA